MLTEKAMPCHAKSKDIKHSLILLQINSLYTNSPEKQVVVFCVKFSPLAEVAFECLSFTIQQALAIVS